MKLITTAEIARVTNRTTAGQMAGRWKNQKSCKAGKGAGRGWVADNNQMEQLVKQQGQRQRSQAWQGQNRLNDWSLPAWKGKNSTKVSSKGSTNSVDEASDSDWWARSDGSQPS